MKIQRIQIKDYKRFHDLTIDLGESPKRIVALVGPNGCGKSSVFDAMLYHMSAYGQIGNTGSKDYRYHSLNEEKRIDYKNIEISFQFGSFSQIYNAKKQFGKEKTIFSFRSPFRYNSDLNVLEAKAVDELRLNNFGATTTSSLDQKMEQNYRRLNIKYNRFLNDNDCKPSEAKMHIIGELNKSIKNCLNLEITYLGDIEAGKGTLYFQKEDYSNIFSYNVLSAGEKEVIDIILDLYLRKEDFDDSVIIIDEPELHLNTAIQRKLLGEINNLVGQDCQIWLATHSIGFLRALQEELKNDSQIIEFKQENKWAKEKYILSPIKGNRENWKSIFNTALDDLTNLISPNRIVYCEGRSDSNIGHIELGFDAKVYNTIFSENYPDTVFVSSGGNTELDQRSALALTILSKVFTEIEILVLKDRDMASGKITDTKARQLYLENNPDNHRVLKRWEIENYLFDKEVLRKYCSNNLLCFDETTYDCFVTEISSQNLKDQMGRIKNICNLLGSISAENFKLNLAKCIDENMEVYKELEQVIFSRS